MATDFSSRPKPPVLKRFANLDIDGVERPARPAKADSEPRARAGATPRTSAAPAASPPPPTVRASELDQDVRDLEVLAEDLNDNARTTRSAPRQPRTRFNQPMPDSPASRLRSERAAELRALRPPDPVLPPPPPSRRMAMNVERTSYNARPWEAPRAPRPGRVDLEELPPSAGGIDTPGLRGDFEGLTPGVITMEIDLSRRSRMHGASARVPLELTEMAARQVMLMSWESGVPGSPLRILTTHIGGLGRPEIDFAFDDNVEPDDIVYECHGVTILIDPQSLRWVAGRRVTWHDVPGSEGFRVG